MPGVPLRRPITLVFAQVLLQAGALRDCAAPDDRFRRDAKSAVGDGRSEESTALHPKRVSDVGPQMYVTQ